MGEVQCNGSCMDKKFSVKRTVQGNCLLHQRRTCLLSLKQRFEKVNGCQLVLFINNWILTQGLHIYLLTDWSLCGMNMIPWLLFLVVIVQFPENMLNIINSKSCYKSWCNWMTMLIIEVESKWWLPCPLLASKFPFNPRKIRERGILYGW